jgi:hypothetical protein
MSRGQIRYDNSNFLALNLSLITVQWSWKRSVTSFAIYSHDTFLAASYRALPFSADIGTTLTRGQSGRVSDHG